jgi:hypothetical protein
VVCCCCCLLLHACCFFPASRILLFLMCLLTVTWWQRGIPAHSCNSKSKHTLYLDVSLLFVLRAEPLMGAGCFLLAATLARMAGAGRRAGGTLRRRPASPACPTRQALLSAQALPVLRCHSRAWWGGGPATGQSLQRPRQCHCGENALRIIQWQYYSALPCIAPAQSWRAGTEGKISVTERTCANGSLLLRTRTISRCCAVASPRLAAISGVCRPSGAPDICG